MVLLLVNSVSVLLLFALNVLLPPFAQFKVFSRTQQKATK